MSFQSKFCMIGAPIVAFGFLLQAIDDPAPVEPNTKPAITEQVEPRTSEFLVISEIRHGFVEVTNISGKDIWRAEFRLSYYGNDSEYGNFSGGLDIGYLPNGKSTLVAFTYGTTRHAPFFRVVDERITYLPDNSQGDRLRAIATKEPGELSRADCYVLAGHAPEKPCDALKSEGASTEVDQERRAAREAIEDGTLEYAQEFAGK